MIERGFSLPISLLVTIFLILPKFSSSTWNFSSVDLPNDVPIWKFSFWRNRAFLAIPHFSRRDNRTNRELTLVEACWPEPTSYRSNFVTTLPDNDVRVFPRSSIDTSECGGLLSVVGLDVESRGRLWILDSSEETNCPAKIVVYDLRRNDLEVARADLHGIPKNNLRTLAIDSLFGISGPRAYIGDPGDESIIVYSLFKNRWWRLRLVNAYGVPSCTVTEIAISRKSALLYLTDSRSQDLFSLDLDELRNDEGPLVILNHDMERNATVNWLGRKMGRSSGLAIDQRGGLHYFLVTEHASVRWDTKRDLKASSYSILLQSAEVPCITDYRLDTQRNVWGLVNRRNPLFENANVTFHATWNGRFRTIRIFKHNPAAR